MSTKFGSGLAIAGAAALVIAAGVTAYYVASNRAQLAPGSEPLAMVQEQTVQDETGPAKSEPEPTVQAEPEVVEPEPTVVEPETAVVEPETTIAEPEPENDTVKGRPPSFDLVRVEKSGSTVVAGRATPKTQISVVMDGEIIGSARADANGVFVVLLDLPPSDVPREIGLSTGQGEDADLVSSDKVLVMPFKADASSAPDLILAKPNGVEFIAQNGKINVAKVQSQDNATEPEASSGLSLDTIVYDDLGDVVISGRSNSADFVRIYLDNKPADTQKVPKDGKWKVTLPDVPDGLYALRVDSLDTAGSVTERVQSPFKREAAQTVVASAKALASNVTIQPGYTLWALAAERYGDGVRYVQIFEANRDHIKNPDLIYPGQIFDLPD